MVFREEDKVYWLYRKNKGESGFRPFYDTKSPIEAHAHLREAMKQKPKMIYQVKEVILKTNLFTPEEFVRDRIKPAKK